MNVSAREVFKKSKIIGIGPVDFFRAISVLTFSRNEFYIFLHSRPDVFGECVDIFKSLQLFEFFELGAPLENLNRSSSETLEN